MGASLIPGSSSGVRATSALSTSRRNRCSATRVAGGVSRSIRARSGTTMSAHAASFVLDFLGMRLSELNCGRVLLGTTRETQRRAQSGGSVRAIATELLQDALTLADG